MPRAKVLKRERTVPVRIRVASRSADSAITEVSLGCLVRTIGSLILLLAILIAARRLTEKEAGIPPPAAGERDTVVAGVRWRSRESPGRRDPTVVYVHGFLSSSATWKKALAPASDEHEAIAVDLPGSGFSDRPWPYDYTAYGQAQHLLRYLEARDIRHTMLVGNSFGGAVCAVAAAARPDRVAGLVLVDSAWPKMRIPLGFRMLRLPVVGELQLELLTRPVMAFTLRHRLYANESLVSEETVDDWWTPVRVPGTRRAALEAVRTSLRGSEAVLGKIRGPTLVLWGKDDRLIPQSEGLALSAAIPGARFATIPGVGHLPQEESPAEFARAVSSFLGGLPGGANPGRANPVPAR